MRRFVSVALIVVGLGLMMIGLLAGLFYLGLPVVSTNANYDLLQINTVAVSVLAVGGVAGAMLAWVGWRRYTGASPRAVRMINPLWFALLFFVALGLGQAVLGTRLAPWVFPPLHGLASIAPPLFFLALAAWFVQPTGVLVLRRDLTLQVAGGAALATALALVIEAILIVLLALAAALVVALTPGGAARLDALASQLSQPGILRDPVFLQSLLNSPLVLIGGGLVVAVVAPLIEEFAKSVGVLLLGVARGSLRPAEAFLWGVAAGAGFAITETMFNTISALPASWSGSLLLRAATAMLHCLCAGLMGLAWQAWFSGERRWRLAAYYALAVAIHGLWNAVTALASVLQLQGAFSQNLLLLSGGVLLLFALGGLFIINSGLFVYFSRRVGQPPATALPPLPAFD